MSMLNHMMYNYLLIFNRFYILHHKVHMLKFMDDKLMVIHMIQCTFYYIKLMMEHMMYKNQLYFSKLNSLCYIINNFQLHYLLQYYQEDTTLNMYYSKSSKWVDMLDRNLNYYKFDMVLHN